MTPAELGARAKDLAARWWAVPALLVLAAILLTWRLEEGRRAEADRARLEAEARLRAEGLLVTEQARGRTLEAEARRLASQNQELAAELERARRAAPGARVTGTVSATTGGVTAGGAARPGGSLPANPGPAAVGAAAPPVQPTQGAAAGGAAPACVLADGDVGEIRVDQVALETREGAQLLVGAASAWRLDPAPRTKVLSGGFRATLSTAKAEEEPKPPGWGAGLYAGAGRDGWVLGPAVGLPPARFWGLQAEVVIGAGVGPSGAWNGAGTALLRF